MHKALRSIVVGLIPGSLIACTGGRTPDWSTMGPPSEVRIAGSGAVYTLYRNGEPFFVNGAGGTTHLDLLAKMGGNAIRTWDAEGIDDLMNEAHRLGLAVQAGIWLEHERHGYDSDDPAFRAKQLAKVRRLVNRYKDHPALLTWGVGNEVELGGDLDKALRAIEDAAEVIKELDPNHPTIAIVAEIGDDKARRIAEECPSIDALGVNAYGGMASVPARLLAQGYEGPFLITEYGPLGHWEGAHAPWGAPYEQPSAAKASFIGNNYAAAVEANRQGRCLGSFAFVWGNKQETTETWFGLLLPTGEMTQTVERLSAFWTGEPASTHAPRVGGIALDLGNAGAVAPGQLFHAEVRTEDPDGDPLDIRWRVVEESSDRRSGGDVEAAPPEVPGSVRSQEGDGAVIVAPARPGAYRVFVTVLDGTGWGGTANAPFYVKGTDGAD